jgi:hypothetical protein
VTPAQQQELLARELDGAGIAFTMRAAKGQRPEAGFRYAEAHGPTLPFTATIRNGALQVAAHDVAPNFDPASAVAGLHALNARWGVGNARYVEERKSCRLTGGYPVFARRPGDSLLRLLIANLYTVGAVLPSGGEAVWKDACEAADEMRMCFPPSNMAESVDALTAALYGIGHPFQPADGAGLRQVFHEPGGNKFAVTFAPRDTRIMRVETTSQTFTGMTPDKADRLNEAAPIGCFISGGAPSVVHAWEFSPEFSAITERLAAWMIEVGAQMSAAARDN